MKKTLSQRFFLPLCLLTLFGILGGNHAWAENFSQTYSYGDLTGWSLTNYSDQKSYYLIPSSGNESVATISGIFTGKTISSAVKITINSATYGKGTDPSASTYAIFSDTDCTTAVAATKSGKLPTSKTYTDVIYTVSQADASAFTKDLAIKFTKPGKQIRLKSIKVEFSYSSGGGESLPDATSIMELRRLGAGTHSIMLTDAIVTYVNGKNGFVQDATGGLMLYATNTLKVGDKISGPVNVVLVDYKGTDEATTFDVSAATITSDNPLPLTTLTIQDLITGDGIKTYESMRVKITDVVVKNAIVSRNGTISQDDSSIALREGVDGCLSTTYMMNVNSMGNVIGYPITFTSGENTTLQLSVMSADAVEETGYNLVVSAAGYATYFNSAKAFTMPVGATGYVWYKGKIEFAYDSEANVPANEPLVVKAPAGNYALLFSSFTDETLKSAEMNDLEGTDVETPITDDDAYYFYGLSLNASHDPASVGFYWMNATGAAFTNGAHKAYLKLDKNALAGSQAVKGFPFNGTTTGIEQIEAGADAKNAIYDLSGRRVNKAAKGIYILNGKKVLVK